MRYFIFVMLFFVWGNASTGVVVSKMSTTERVEQKLDKFNDNVLRLDAQIHEKFK